MRDAAKRQPPSLATTTTARGPAPTGQWIIVLSLCKAPGTCYPSNTRQDAIDPTANANDLIAALSVGFNSYWFRRDDPTWQTEVNTLLALYQAGQPLP